MKENQNVCDICGQTHDDLTEVHAGYLICPDCLLKYYGQCDDCYEWHRLDDLTEVHNGDLVCPDCLEENYSCCEHCGGWFPVDDLVSVNDGEELWCQDCAEEHAYQCDDCGDWYTERNIWLRDDYRAICRQCADNWVACADCGEVLPVDNAYEHDNSWYCESCYADHRDGIHDYSYKPYPEIRRMPGEPESALTFGVELEVDDGDEDPAETAADVVSVSGGRVYCKHDGSLNEGFEIVTHPGSLGHHMSEMNWGGICEVCLDAGYQSHNTSTCGLHIHVGRHGLGPDYESRCRTAANLVVLTEQLWDALVIFSRRKAENLRHWAGRPYLDLSTNDPEDLYYHALGTESHGRYQAVNLTNASTVEFRIFRGTLRPETILACLQLVNDLCLYAMTHDIEACRNASFEDVVGMGRYTELLDYCRARDLLPKPGTQVQIRPRDQPAPAPVLSPAF